MAVTPFRHIDFVNHEPVTKEKLDQLQSNVQWIVDNTPLTLHVNDLGQATMSSLIVVGGSVNIYMPWGTGSSNVLFNGAFDSDAQPIITTGIVSETSKQLWCTFKGLDTTVFPDARGFSVSVSNTPTNNVNLLSAYVLVYWMAIGKRSIDYDTF